MNPVFLAIIFGLACALFLAASFFVFRALHWVSYRGEWITLGAAFLMAAGLAGMQTYLEATAATSTTPDLVAGMLALAAGILACFGAYSMGIRFSLEHISQAAAQQELKRYRQSFEENAFSLVLKDREGKYLAVSDAYAQFLGKKEQDLDGEADFNFFPRSQATAFRQEEEKAIEAGATLTRDEEMRGIDGVRWLRVTRTPLLDANKAVIGLLISGQDITAQKQSESALAAWKQGLATLFDAETALEEPAEAATTFESLLFWASKLAGTQHAGLWQMAPERSAAMLKAGSGKLERLREVQLRPGEDLPWKVWKSGQAAMVNDYANWPDRGPWAREMGLSAAIGLPLRGEAQVTHVLTLFHDKPGQSFGEEQAQLLGLFAQVAASRLQAQEHLQALKGELEERQQALGKLHFRARLEHALAIIATHFIILEAEKVDEGINHSLQTIARLAGIERCYLTLFPRPGYAATDLPTWYSNGNGAAEAWIEDISAEQFRWYLGKLNQFETVHIPRLGELPAEEEQAVAYLQSRGVKSFTAIPLVSNRSVIGYLGFEALKAEVEWTPEVLSLLKISAEMFVNLLERKWTAKGMKESQEKISLQILSLEQRNRESALITEMGDLLQACRTADEAYPIITRYLQRLIPLGSGALYMIHDAKDPAEKVATWGEAPPGPAEHEMALNECWGLRRGRTYIVQDPTAEPLCGHLKDQLQAGYMCVPLNAQGVAAGVLHLRLDPDRLKAGYFNEDQQRLATKAAEYIAIALTNLKLRDDLRGQAIRDPLTGLFNRRYMEETLDREIRRAGRHTTTVGVIMFDIDHMKPINDQFGHDAGDVVLRALGRELLRMFRGEDVACRYGGDEFTVVLPEATLADAWRRAEQIREVTKRLDLQYDGHNLGALTLSIGIAAYPDHGLSAEKVLLASDAASYASKSEGGDRIMVGNTGEA